MGQKSENIKLFDNRRSPRYLAALKKSLSIKNLIENAIDTPERLTDRTEFKKICPISFLGISANNLFDNGRNFLNDGNDIMYQEMENIFKSHQRFEEAGIWLRIRFMFIYPYSSHAMSIINAEMTHERCAIEGDWEHPSVQRKFQVNPKNFDGSSFVRSQGLSLNLIQRWYEKYQFNNSRGKRSVIVRFTPVSPNLCCLIINNTAYCDSYLLSKKYRHSERLNFGSPLVQIEKASNVNSGEEPFEQVENHFQYLWQLNITLDCQDATRYGPGKRDTLSEMRPPESINFLQKSERLKQQGCITSGYAPKWRKKAIAQFKRYLALPEDFVDEEQIFISCGWTNGSPPLLAQKLRDWIKSNFTRELLPNLKPVLIEGRVGDMISNIVYDGLEECSLGVVLLLPDLEVVDPETQKTSRMSKPNVYHELGYLMSKFGKNSSGNLKSVFVVASSEIEVASNLTNIFLHRIEDQNSHRERLKLFSKFLVWLNKNSVLVSSQKPILCKVIRHHKKKLQEAFKEGDNVFKKIDDLLGKLECDKLKSQNL